MERTYASAGSFADLTGFEEDLNVSAARRDMAGERRRMAWRRGEIWRSAALGTSG